MEGKWEYRFAHRFKLKESIAICCRDCDVGLSGLLLFRSGTKNLRLEGARPCLAAFANQGSSEFQTGEREGDVDADQENVDRSSFLFGCIFY